MASSVCPSCTLGGAADRQITGSATVPMEIPSAPTVHWCAEPAAGQDDGAGPWPPAAPGLGTWSCGSPDGPIVAGEGAGIASFSGTTEAGPFRVELLVGGGSWRFATPRTFP